MRYLPIVLAIGIFANTACVIVFRLKLDRAYNTKFEKIKYELSQQIYSMSSDALSAIDNYFKSNVTVFVETVARQSRFNSSDTISKSNTPIYEQVGDWDYTVYRVNDTIFARCGFDDFCIGDRFPRGGFITDIFADGLVIDNRYWVNNRNYRNISDRDLLSKNANNDITLNNTLLEDTKL